MFETIYLSDIRFHNIYEMTSLVKTEIFGVTHKGDFIGIVTKNDHYLGMPVTSVRKGEVVYTSVIKYPDGQSDSYEETELNEILTRLLESFYNEEIKLKVKW